MFSNRTINGSTIGINQWFADALHGGITAYAVYYFYYHHTTTITIELHKTHKQNLRIFTIYTSIIKYVNFWVNVSCAFLYCFADDIALLLP